MPRPRPPPLIIPSSHETHAQTISNIDNLLRLAHTPSHSYRPDDSFSLDSAPYHAALTSSSTNAAFGVYAASVQMENSYALDANNRPLTHKATRTAWDADLWRTEESNELTRLLETTKTFHFITQSDKPTNRLASYYNPQVKVKIKDGAINRRVRGTYGGNISDYTGNRSS